MERERGGLCVVVTSEMVEGGEREDVKVLVWVLWWESNKGKPDGDTSQYLFI